MEQVSLYHFHGALLPSNDGTVPTPPISWRKVKSLIATLCCPLYDDYRWGRERKESNESLLLLYPHFIPIYRELITPEAHNPEEGEKWAEPGVFISTRRIH